MSIAKSSPRFKKAHSQVKPDSQVDSESQVDNNLEVNIKSQIRPNQIKPQTEAQNKVKVNV